MTGTLPNSFYVPLSLLAASGLRDVINVLNCAVASKLESTPRVQTSIRQRRLLSKVLPLLNMYQ